MTKLERKKSIIKEKKGKNTKKKQYYKLIL